MHSVQYWLCLQRRNAPKYASFCEHCKLSCGTTCLWKCWDGATLGLTCGLLHDIASGDTKYQIRCLLSLTGCNQH